MLTPDEVAAGMLPPLSSEAPAAQVHRLADVGIALAEQLQAVVPEGRHQRAAYTHLVRTMQAAYAGLEPALVPYDHTPDLPVPYALVGEQAREHPAPVDHVDQGDPLVLDVAVWRLGITTGTLHPLTRLVALVLSEACGPSGYIPEVAQPTLTELSARTALSLHAVHHHLADLCTDGWISRHATTEYGTRRTRYQLRLPGATNR
jgi:hypothetical protein